MEKITIIIPAFNAEKDIRRCLESVCKQTYQNLEILVINDGSVDRTESICLEYQYCFPALKLVNAEHKGVSAARNKGMQMATGSYLFFLDADDELSPMGIEVLEKYSKKGDWVIGNYHSVNVNESEKPVYHTQYFSEEVHQGDKSELPQLCTSRNFNCVWGKLYSAEIIRRRELLFDEKRDYGEDLVFNLEYFQNVNKFIILKESVYRYCYRFGEGLGTRYRKNEWKIQAELCERMKWICENVLLFNLEDCIRMNHFYYAQAIAALQRIADEKSLSPREKRMEMRKITESDLFLEILRNEYDAKRIGIIDYVLLKSNMGRTYHYLHKSYVLIKNRLVVRG